jgi:hypothetical protein
MPTSTFDMNTIAGRAAYAANMAAKVATPEYAVPDTLINEVQEANAELQAAVADANDPAKRTSSSIALRDQRLRDFRRLASRVVSIVRGNAELDDKQLEDLGVQPIKTRRKEIPAPTEAPVLTAYLERGNIVVKLRRVAEGRGKPENAKMATVFRHVGPTPPEAWLPGMTVTKTTLSFPIPASQSGETLWICAFWQNATGASGPTSRPVSVSLPATQARPIEQEQATPMRIAA